jgi:transcriptional regulator with XRE-family HTH domain
MGNESSDQAFADVGDVIAANLRRLRTARRMSLATLASRADVAKATLANLEQGRGNPTIETLWSLALGLGVAFSDLLEDRRETTTVVVRAQQGARVRGSTPGGQLDLRLLDRIERGGLVEVFDLFLPARTDHLGSPHGTGVVERVFVHAGTITVGPASDPVTLGPGDYARYSGDGPHVYRSAEEDVHGMLLVGYPPALGALMTGFDYLVVGGGHRRLHRRGPPGRGLRRLGRPARLNPLAPPAPAASARWPMAG